ncbi:lysophospholipid acyltransferase family protein [Thermaurantiacus sp.]
MTLGEAAIRSASGRGPAPARPRPFRPAGPWRTIPASIALTGTMVPAYAALKPVHGAIRLHMPRLYHGLLARAFGIHVRLLGTPASGAVLYVANHLSWLDIPVLGSKLPGSFVAKHEVSEMAIVKHLANLQDTIYVTREARHQAAAQASAVRARLARGDNVILFPEGTSNDGVRILPFKSSLFAGLDGPLGERVRVQPVTLAYTRLNGLPLTRSRQLELAWIGDMALAPHAFDVMKLGRLEAAILCHPPVRPADFPDRKALARHCRSAVEAGYRRLTRGLAP